MGHRLPTAAVALLAWVAISPAGAKTRRAPSAFDLPVAAERFDWPGPLAQRNDLYAVRGSPDGRSIWAVGATGTVLSLRGTNATLEAAGTDADLYDLWVAAADDVWIVGARGTILHGDGKRWSAVRSGTKQPLYSIWGRSAQDLWIGGGGGTILHREANRWRAVPVSTKGPIASVVGCERDAICALTLANRLPSIDRSNAPCDDPDGCAADEPQEPLGDRILRWSDGRWSPMPSYGGVSPERMISAGPAFWLIHQDLLSSVRAGKTDLRPVLLPKDTETIGLNGAWAGGEDDGWLVGERCTQERPGADERCDRGAIWRVTRSVASLRSEAPATLLFGVWAWSKTGAIAVGRHGTIVRFDGETWTAVSKPVTDVDLRGVWSVSTAVDKNKLGPVGVRASDDHTRALAASLIVPGDRIAWGLPKAGGVVALPRIRSEAEVWLIGDCQALRARDRGWVTYLTRDCEARTATREVLGLDSGEVWITPGYAAAVSVSHWNGRTWAPLPSPSRAPPADVWASASDDVWLVGGRDVVRWDGHKLAAVAPPPGLEASDQLTSVWGADAKTVWVAATDGAEVKLARWDGERWAPPVSFGLALPRRWVLPDSAADLSPPRFIEQSRLVALWGTSSADIWLAGPNGIVLRFDGDRWQRVGTPTRHPLFGLGGTPDHVVAVGASGTILELDRRPE